MTFLLSLDDRVCATLYRQLNMQEQCLYCSVGMDVPATCMALHLSPEPFTNHIIKKGGGKHDVLGKIVNVSGQGE
ncbi:hypothetical protein PUR_02370 [Paenibacillus sp. URB8-2]|nr:hypothetical protein PUR_02370 [Paenibacillus sp. URB8-2]